MNVSSWAFYSAALSDSEDTQSCREELQTLVLWVYRGSGSNLLRSTGETYRHTLKVTAIFRGFLRIVLRDKWQKRSCVIHLCSFAIRFCCVPLKYIIRRCPSYSPSFLSVFVCCTWSIYKPSRGQHLRYVYDFFFFLNDPIFKNEEPLEAQVQKHKLGSLPESHPYNCNTCQHPEVHIHE